MNPASYLRHAVPSWWALASAARPPGRIAVLGTVWPHHAKRSGYQPVADGLGLLLKRQRMRLVPVWVSRRIAGAGFEEAHQIALAMKLTRRDQLLVIDGDFGLDSIEGLRRLTRARIYAVFHQVPSVLRETVFTPGLLDGAVCVARCQIPFVKAAAPAGKTWFVPHGVDTNHFSPEQPRSNAPVVLSVGCHQRDFDTLRESSEIIGRAVPEARFRLVAPRALLPRGLNLGRVELVSDLTDEELVDEYRKAWVVLLTLKESTANNALLEAMACGTPVVVTDVGGARDYADADCGGLCPPGNARAHARAAMELLEDRAWHQKASMASRARAERFEWKRVREQLRVILEAEPEPGSA